MLVGYENVAYRVLINNRVIVAKYVDVVGYENVAYRVLINNRVIVAKYVDVH